MSIKNSRLKTTSLLIFLYSLQGLILALLLDTLEIQLKQDFTYSEVGIFLLCSYPFSLKILWSPIVDSYYLKKIGRRKTWVILTQSIVVIILIYLYINVQEILYYKRIYFLTIISFLLMFLISTQDIAVDGWSLTLCGKEVSINSYSNN
jgi:PAT family acetyl-CoA transporter-like MFS transporter 1